MLSDLSKSCFYSAMVHISAKLQGDTLASVLTAFLYSQKATLRFITIKHINSQNRKCK